MSMPASRDQTKVRQPAPLTDGRLGARPTRTLIDQVNRIELDDELLGFEEYVEIDLAHALMLTTRGVFAEAQGREIVTALLELLVTGADGQLELDPAVGTLGLQIERYLERRCGTVGLDIQRARSRIDQKATGWRMINRRHLLLVMQELLAYAGSVLAAGERFRGAIVPGYTHLQHSQPTSLDHYFDAHFRSASRNLDRLREIYARLNRSPLGGAAYSGTSWPIDRESTAGGLGFDGLIVNARDAGMASIDLGPELATGLALTLAGVARLASDLNYWASSEVELVTVHASLSGTSSMMPQKRNPMSLERIRGLAGSAAGWSAGQLGILHTATSTDVDQAYVHNTFPANSLETAGAIRLLREVVETIEIDAGRMRDSASRHWSTASALADELTAAHGMSFREAHETVARFIAAHEAAGLGQHELSPDLADAPLCGYSRERLQQILDPDEFVRTRISEGGTSPAARSRLAASATAELVEHSAAIGALSEQVRAARADLLRRARFLADSTPNA